MDETAARDQWLAHLRHEEMKGPPRKFLVSFGAAGMYLGSCVVVAIGPLHAVGRTVELGINPGPDTDVQIYPWRDAVPLPLDTFLEEDDIRAVFEEWEP